MSQTGDGPRGAATRMREDVLASAEPLAALEELAATANDPSLRPRTRATALLAISLAATAGGLPIPEAALEAIDDPLVIDEALRSGMVSALTGVLALSPKQDGQLAATRALIGSRLLSAGERGPHVTGLLVDAEEYDLAATAAADDFVASIMPALVSPNAMVYACAAIALSWLADRQERLFVLFCRELRRHEGAVEALARMLSSLPHAPPALVGAALEIVTSGGDAD